MLEPSDEAYEAVLSLRVVRAFRSDPIPRADVDAILQAGRWTGSSKNRQGWGLVVIDDRDGLELLASAGRFSDPIRAAAVAIALVKTAEGNDFDIGRLAQNLMLAAAARGVGSCPITLHDTARSAEVLGLPDDAECHYAIAFGMPDEDREASQRAARRDRGVAGRKPVEEIVRRGRWKT
ncbi:MAG TPA: nitroreductase family protein [Acidimicrobiia bacterium]|nr:nitroreductase family protein [Acidimicrobiia bacterium]